MTETAKATKGDVQVFTGMDLLNKAHVAHLAGIDVWYDNARTSHGPVEFYYPDNCGKGAAFMITNFLSGSGPEIDALIPAFEQQITGLVETNRYQP